MNDFTEMDNTTTFPIRFEALERLTLQTLILRYVNNKWHKGTISESESVKLEHLSKRLESKLFLGFIGNRYKDIVVSLTPDEIRKLFIVTLDMKEEIESGIKELELQLKINEKHFLLEKKQTSLKELIDILKLNKKFAITMKDKIKYFNKKTHRNQMALTTKM
jgi:hypothetical protein